MLQLLVILVSVLCSMHLWLAWPVNRTLVFDSLTEVGSRLGFLGAVVTVTWGLSCLSRMLRMANRILLGLTFTVNARYVRGLRLTSRIPCFVLVKVVLAEVMAAAPVMLFPRPVIVMTCEPIIRFRTPSCFEVSPRFSEYVVADSIF